MITKIIGAILTVLFRTLSKIKWILNPNNPNRKPIIIKSNKDQFTWLEKIVPKSGINNRNRGDKTLLITIKFMIRYVFIN